MSTASLRRDHDLIEKVIKSMETTVLMLRGGAIVPESILMQVMDFATNFTDTCHHSKEEKTLFPALAKPGMPTNVGPIGVMLSEHKKTRQIAESMKESANMYLKSGDAENLIADIDLYTKHVTDHLWKENNRLFMMADMRLAESSDEIDAELAKSEADLLSMTGNPRSHYERISKDLTEYATEGEKSF